MANDFSSDGSWVGIYRFEPGALLVDSSGTGNTLTNVNNVVGNTVDFDEGACSADFENQTSSRLSVNNVSLSSNFPGKAGYTNVAVTSRFRFESTWATNNLRYLIGKWQTDGARSWALRVSYLDGVFYLQFCLGYDSGNSQEIINLCTFTPDTTSWFFVALSYNDSARTYVYQLYQRGTTDTLISQGSGSTINQMSPDNGVFAIGCAYANSSSGTGYWDGEIDECCIANTPKTQDDFNAIRTFAYGSGGTSIVPINGSFGAVAEVSGTVAKKVQAAGEFAGFAEATGSIGITRLLSGSIGAQAGVSDLVVVKRSLAGELACTASVSASMGMIRRLSGSAGAVAAIEGEAVILAGGSMIRLSGSMDAIAALECVFNVKRGLTGTIAAGPEMIGRVSVRMNLSGSVEAVGEMIGALQFIGQGTLGVVVDPSIDSVTVRRLLASISTKRSIHGIPAEHAIESI